MSSVQPSKIFQMIPADFLTSVTAVLVHNLALAKQLGGDSLATMKLVMMQSHSHR